MGFQSEAGYRPPQERVNPAKVSFLRSQSEVSTPRIPRKECSARGSQARYAQGGGRDGRSQSAGG
jgi:hypothetical protein